MNLQQLRDYIRTQMDMDDEELPNALLDAYLNEGFQRAIALEDRWPFYETTFELAKVPGSADVALPPDCDPPGLLTVYDVNNAIRLMQVSTELALDRFGKQIGSPPTYYSIIGNSLRLWPNPNIDSTYNYAAIGHRKPIDWVAAGPDAEVDADSRLHILLAHYAIALVYAMEEDEVLEGTYMQRFQVGWNAVHGAICEPRHHRPLILNGGTPYLPNYIPVEWNIPA